MNDSIIEVAGNTYKIGQIDAFKQFHVARRLTPALLAMSKSSASLQEKFGGLKDGTALEEAFTSLSDNQAIDLFGPMIDAISHMSDEDTDYVIKTCLSCVYREQGENKWQHVIAKGGGLMFQDIGMPQMLQLTFAVIRGNIGNFFAALPASPQAGAGQQ